MSDQEYLTRRKAELFEQVKIARVKLEKGQDLLHKYEERYYKTKHEFEDIDHQLAMIDGRYKVYKPNYSKKKTATDEELILGLSKEKILKIAAILGFEVEEGEE